MTEAEKFYGQADRDKHALAVGRIVLAWSEFQEVLGQLYAGLFGKEGWVKALTEWQAQKSDHQQRQLLRKVVPDNLAMDEKTKEELIWLLDQTDEVIADQRNVGVHAPLMSFTDEKGKHQIVPLAMFGNKRAASLAGKDILTEYDHYEGQIRKIATYAIAIQHNISPVRAGEVVWPDRPKFKKTARRCIDDLTDNKPTRRQSKSANSLQS
jgi:Na+-translocating ferredoxin:NAD+ oxidoreductase RnfG subunit